MRGILSAQTEIDEIHAVIAAPLQCAKNHGNVRGQLAVKNLHRVKLGIRRFFADCACHRRAVSQPVDCVWALSGERDLDGARDFADVGMAGMYPAIDDRDLHAASRCVSYGSTAIPAGVMSVWRSQVFSSLSVAASYTSISKPAP